MNNVQIFHDKHQLAVAAAEQSIQILQDAIARYGNATWVLAGGTAPTLAYHEIVARYLEVVDWQKVTFVIGDERIGPLGGPDNNWHAIEQSFLHRVPQATFLRPKSNQSAASAADDYEKQLQPIDRFDLVWLGMGEDGHTLSLFPDHPDFRPTDRLVITVHHSPKPPANRISLTLYALANAQSTLILTSGKAKAPAIQAAFQPESTLPIAQAATLTQARWLIDQSAAELIQ
jgi:6-phosphogluconolactonase